VIESGWVSPEYNAGGLSFLRIGGYDPTVQAVYSPDTVTIPLPQVTQSPQNCACLIGTAYVENGECKCADPSNPSPQESKPVRVITVKPREIIANNSSQILQAGQGINPLFLIGGAVILFLLLKD